MPVFVIFMQNSTVSLYLATSLPLINLTSSNGQLALQITSTVAESYAVTVLFWWSYAVTFALFVTFPHCVNVVVQLHVIDSLTTKLSFGQLTSAHLSSLTLIFIKFTFPVFIMS